VRDRQTIASWAAVQMGLVALARRLELLDAAATFAGNWAQEDELVKAVDALS
jgi:hypothetical protein